MLPFGYEVSYTSFKYSCIKIHPGTGAGGFEVSFDVPIRAPAPGRMWPGLRGGQLHGAREPLIG
jgi:hypothetical protein